MAHVVTAPTRFTGSAPGAAGQRAPLSVHVLPAWEDNLVFVLVCETTGQAAVIDAPQAAPVLAYAEAQGLALGAIFNTHTHGDHIGINRDLVKSGKIESFRVVGCPDRGIPGLTEPVDDGALATLGALTVQVWRTEGHQDGHLTFVVGDVAFTGDTLFTGGCGYLFDGPPAKMHASLMRLAALPPTTRVCCAHEYTLDNLRFAWSLEPESEALAARIRAVRACLAEGRPAVPSTVGDERATNPFLRGDVPALRARVAAELAEAGRDLPMTTPAEVFAATRVLKDSKRYKRLTDADLPA